MARTQWETDVAARREVRAELASIIKSIGSEWEGPLPKLQEAAARLNGDDRLRAENASGDLSLAEDRTDDPALRKRIKSLRQELDRLLHGPTTRRQRA